MVFEKLLQFFKDSEISYKHIQHPPTHTCEESAQARNEPLEIGAKAIVMSLDNTYALFVLSASKRIDSKKIKALLRCRSVRFATAEELWELTSLLPGSIPPFGKPILPFDLYVDLSIQQLSQIAFNAGSLSDSIVMAAKDYLKISNLQLCSFSK